MSEAGDDIPIDQPEEQVEVTATDAPKGKLTVEEALQVLASASYSPDKSSQSRCVVASLEDCPFSRWPCPRPS